MSVRSYQSIQYKDGLYIKSDTPLAIEQALQIIVNGKPFTTTMRTPGDDICLVRGILYSEEIITDTTVNVNIDIVEDKQNNITLASVEIIEKYLGPGIQKTRSQVSVSSCGICGLESLDLKSDRQITKKNVPTFDHKTIFGLFEQMEVCQFQFDTTGGTHAAAIYDINLNQLACMEDIGRHNAVDKAIGKLIVDGTFENSMCLTVSGRVSYEIVLKAAMANIPVLAAVSAPSSMAVDQANKFGIHLFAFCRNDRFTCYSKFENPRQILKN